MIVVGSFGLIVMCLVCWLVVLMVFYLLSFVLLLFVVVEILLYEEDMFWCLL